MHDNFIGDEGLIALARSPVLTRLVELDLEQDCWNFRQARFADQAAWSVAESSAFARLDALFGGCVDEYHGERSEHPFSAAGRAAIQAATGPRPTLRRGLRRANADQDAIDWAPTETALEEIRRIRRQHDFRLRGDEDSTTG